MLFLGYGITAAGNVAKVGDTEYATFDEALAAWVDGTKLTLLEDVTVNKEIKIGSYNSSTGEITSGGVKEFNLGDNKTITFDYQSTTKITVLFKVLRGTLTLSGTGTVTCKPFPGTIGKNIKTPRLVQIFGSPYDNPTEAEYSILNVGKNVTINQPVEYAIEIGGTKLNPSKGKVLDENNISGTKANGVIVNIDGKIISNKYCVKTQGYLAATSDKAPVININDGAVLSDEGTAGNSSAVYASGYAVWHIYGTVTGYTAIYMKAGTVTISNAKISGTGAYNVVVGQSSGFESAGDAITMEANKSYAGQMILNISGQNTSVTSTNGYAIREAVTTAKETETLELSISDGTFTGAEDKGAITYSEELTQALVDGTTSEGYWVQNKITGGTFSSNPYITANGYVVEESGSGETSFTVKEYKPTEIEGKTYITSKTTVDNLTVPENSEIIVETGATLTVTGKLDITANEPSRVIVKAGGKLIAGSILSNDVEDFIVESDLTYGTGVVKYTSGSEVTSPKGTVQLAVAAKQLSANKYKFQHFGIPTTSLPTITKNNVPAAYSDWDRKQGWIYNGGSSSFTEPFVGHNVTVQADEAGTVFTFSGDVVTNQNAEFTLNRSGYTALANSYTAPMDIQAIHNSLEGVQTDKELWIYFANADTIGFTHIGPDYYVLPNPKITKLPAMQGFFLGNEGSETDFTVTYAEAMSDGDTKDAAADVVDGGVISLSDGSRSAELMLLRKDSYEGISGSKQFETEGSLQIYVKEGDNKWATFKANSFDNQFIEIVTQEKTEYTLTFSRLANDAFALYDITDPNNEKEVTITEGGTYSFTAPANQTVQYFRLGVGHLTGAEEAEATELNFWTNDNTLYVAGADADIVVYNAAGVKVAAVKANGDAIQTVNIAGLAGGLYIVESGALTGKFIK